MPRLEKARRRMATLDRRALLACVPAAVLAACQEKIRTTVSTTPEIDLPGLGKAVNAIAARAEPAALGVGLMNLESGQVFTLNAERPFPMMSVFKLPLAVAALDAVDKGELSLAHLPGVFVATNDVAIVTLPDGRRFAIAVMVTGSSAPMAEQERLIARLARTAWDSMAMAP